MAKATAHCTCATCGAEFIRENTCQNRSDANNWEAYAERTFTECSSCYAKRMRKEESDKGLIAEVRIDHSAALMKGEVVMCIIASGDTMPHKDELKALGYHWTDDYPSKGSNALFQLTSADRHVKRWVQKITIDDMVEQIEDFNRIGGKVVSMPEEMEIAMLRNEINHRKTEDAKAEEAAEAACGFSRPKKPESFYAIIGKGKWNGTVYGKAGRYRVYVDGKEVSVSDDAVEDRKKYLKDKEAFEKAYNEANGR